MQSLTDDIKDFVMEWLGHKKPKTSEGPPQPLKDTWVMIMLKEGQRLGGRLIYYAQRGQGMDICLTDVCEAAGEGQWKPSHWKPVEGAQCMIISADNYRFLQFLEEPPECKVK